MSEIEEAKGVVGILGRSYWYHVFLASVFVLGIFLLFLKELPAPIRDYFVPALAIYSLGTAIVGYIQGVQFRKNGMSRSWSEPTLWYAFAHALWFLLLLGYLVYRHVV